MDYLTISRWSIPVLWLAFFGAVFYIDLVMKKQNEPTVKMMDRFVWQYLLVWKVSYIVFSLEQFLAAPSSILYFDGGLRGHVLALISIVYVIWIKRHDLQMDVLVKAWLHFVSAYHVLYFALTGHWILLIIWVSILMASWKFNTQWVLIVQWLLISWISGWFSYFIYGFLLIFILDLLREKKAQLLALAVVAGLISITLSDFEIKKQETARKAIELQTTTGELYRISDQDESYVIVNFFATWCLPCNAEMPHLQSFATKLPENTQLIGVNLTKRDHGEEALLKFVEKFSITFPILLDVDDVFGKSYGVISIPTTVVLKDGVEVQRFVGPVSEQQLRKVVEN
ncbi:TlpA family protein disulfide reductase [Solibacillus daqui]|uniref:TlpA family protein disulfide reductase n=1 Tax=Solibacillus daqui TaxID=2912187 RepID=UPI002365B300|nr:TlpA disulfide reductase family protein [Solibacillus daqui]